MTSSAAPASLEDVIRRELSRGTGDLPVLPRSAAEALILAQKPDLSFEEVIALAETDPPLAARFIGMASSALYGRVGARFSLRTALVRLGVHAIRDVLYMAVYSATSLDGAHYGKAVTSTFEHSVLVARAARRIAKMLGLDGDQFFLAGLLHDVGHARCLKLLARRLPSLSAPELDAALAVIEVFHTTAGARLAAAWHLPPEVIEVCEFHHAPAGRPAAMIVHAADNVGYFANKERGVTEEDVIGTLHELGIGPRSAELICAAVEDAELLGHRD